QDLEGWLRLTVADLLPFTGMLGHPIEGELNLNATARQSSPDRVIATLDGSIEKLHSGIAALDALARGSVAIAGSAQRDADGVLRLDQLTMIGAGSHVAANGSFDTASQLLAATLDTEIGDLQPASGTLGVSLAGKLSGNIAVAGRLDGLRVRARLDGNGIAVGAAALGRLKDLFGTPFGTGRATMTAVSFSSGDLTNASLNLDSARAGRFTFGAEAKGKFIEPVSASLAGAGEFSPDAAAIDIRVSR